MEKFINNKELIINTKGMRNLNFKISILELVLIVCYSFIIGLITTLLNFRGLL